MICNSQNINNRKNCLCKNYVKIKNLIYYLNKANLTKNN